MGLFAHGKHSVAFGLYGHYGWLVDYDFIVVDNDGVGCAEVHRYLLCKRKESHYQLK